MNIIAETEKNFAKFVGTRYAIMVNSGTAALHAVYLAYGVRPGTKVVVPAFTYYSTVNMILACGAEPVFADIDPKTYLISIDDVFKKLTKETVAIVLVNLFGKEIKKREIDILIDAFPGVKMIIDSAQCCKPEMNYGDVQCFSFYKSKNFSCFEGGAIATDNMRLANKCRIISNQGEDGKYNTATLGFNYRMSDITATMLNHQIMYHRPGGIAELGRWGIENGHYPRVVYDQPLYKRLGLYSKWKGSCPNAEKLAKKVREKYWKK